MRQSEIVIISPKIIKAINRVSAAFHARYEYLTDLDRALGDGDLGITIEKIADMLDDYAKTDPAGDLGKWIIGLGMAINRAAPSTMGTLLATALMRAGKEVKGLAVLTPTNLVAMLSAADIGIRERGKAQLGDKTVVDALHPAAETFASAIESGTGLRDAGQRMVDAARHGRDRVTPLKSKIGRSSWVGERTVGLVDGGCEVLVILLEAITDSTEKH